MPDPHMDPHTHTLLWTD